MNLSEDEILNFLMTSEFNEGLTPDEFKLLLKKFRNFYRILWGKYENVLSEVKIKQNKIDDLKGDKEIRYNQVLLEKSLLQDFNKSLLDRKLSWKERWKGKIILNEDEIKRF